MSNLILESLDKVKDLGGGRYNACCPVHNDKHPSMSVKILDDGMVLMHCFACGANGIEIIRALGLSPSELFPPEIKQGNEKRVGYRKTSFDSRQVIDALKLEMMTVIACASDMRAGIVPDDDDMARLFCAQQAIERGLNYGK